MSGLFIWSLYTGGMRQSGLESRERWEVGGNMSVPIHPKPEMKIRARAEADGLSVEEYVDRFVRADQEGSEELESLAIEGLESGEPMEMRASYRQEKHQRLADRLKKSYCR